MVSVVAALFIKLQDVIKEQEENEIIVTDFTVLNKGAVKDFVNKAQVYSSDLTAAISGLRDAAKTLSTEEREGLFVSHPETDINAAVHKGLELLGVINKKVLEASKFYSATFRRATNSVSFDEDRSVNMDMRRTLSFSSDTSYDMDQTIVGRCMEQTSSMGGHDVDVKLESPAPTSGTEFDALMKNMPGLLKAVAIPIGIDDINFDFADAQPSSSRNGRKNSSTSRYNGVSSSPSRPSEDINSPEFMSAFIRSVTTMNNQNVETMKMMREMALNSISNGVSNGFNVRHGPKLKELVLPIFSGEQSEDFETWWDMFSMLIGDNQQLTSVAKLAYLKSYVSKEAKDVIDSLPLQDDCYEIACDNLQERFGFEVLMKNRPYLMLKQLASSGTPNEKQALVKLYHQQFACYKRILQGDYFNTPYMELVKDAYPVVIKKKLHAKEVKCIQDFRRKMSPSEFMSSLSRIVRVHTETLDDTEAMYVYNAVETSPAGQGSNGSRYHFATCHFCNNKGHREFGCPSFPLVADRVKVVSERKLCNGCYREDFNCRGSCNVRCTKCGGSHGIATCPHWQDFRPVQNFSYSG